MSNLMNTLPFRLPEFVSGRGSWLHTSDDKAYLDFFCDVGTASLGYASHEQRSIFRAMLEDHVPAHAPNLYRFDARERAATELCEATGMDKVFFCNSGTEAVEAAIKLARKWQYNARGPNEIWTLRNSFHGRTYGALSAGNGPPHHYEGYWPYAPGFRHFDGIESIIGAIVRRGHIPAAVMLAPVFGNNDVQLYDCEMLRRLREVTTRFNVILIFDEVQTGSGRTGSFTYAQTINVQPDVMTLAKGVGGGIPVGACLARAPYSETFTPGTHFSTFGGNPLCCVAVLHMLRFLRPNIESGRIDDTGVILRRWLRDTGWARNVRGVGALTAFDLETDTVKFAMKCLEHRLLIGAFRAGPGPVKITPPLNITNEDLRIGFEAMCEAAVGLNL